MAAIDWTDIYKRYKGKWVALSSPRENKVIATGKTLKEIIEKAEKKGIKHPLVTQIPRRLLPIVGVL